MKGALKNLLLVIGSVLFSLAAFELFLFATGTYQELASQQLEPSPAIWERPRNAIEQHRHPDLKIPIEIVYDDDGVRNHDRKTTAEKRDIVGFFGDSFTENRRVENRFGFVRILDELAGGKFRMVNFGVDAYGIDQSYLRYKKYHHLDIDTVVDVFCENDLRNLYETGLTALDETGQLSFRQPEANGVLQFVGRFRSPYLILDAYYHARAVLTSTFPGQRIFSDRLHRIADKSSAARKVQKKRLRDTFAQSVVKDITGPSPSQGTLALAQKFRAVLARWRTEVEARGRRFKVLVLPRHADRDVAGKLFGRDADHILYLSDSMPDYMTYRFKYDVHWNETGNLKAAEVVNTSPVFARFFGRSDPGDYFRTKRQEIVAYYDANAH